MAGCARLAPCRPGRRRWRCCWRSARRARPWRRPATPSPEALREAERSAQEARDAARAAAEAARAAAEAEQALARQRAEAGAAPSPPSRPPTPPRPRREAAAVRDVPRWSICNAAPRPSRCCCR
ncbi:hypothetical protein ACFFMP_12175 [Pseudoroseomonas cervicalis]|uniref:hypothetical protein n=1 Tax=Teichococcus cervicalis TaxID=204525 RepID=UPI0035E827A0